MRIGLEPIMMQSCGLMSDQPEGANARRGITLLPLTVGFLALELDLSLEGNGPGAFQAGGTGRQLARPGHRVSSRTALATHPNLQPGPLPSTGL